MMKFFRKYNKQLLAVFMAFLMVVFIGGSALDSLLRPETDFVIGESKYGPVRNSDQQQTKNSVTDLLNMMGRDWQRPFSMAAEPLGLVDWILLVREAEALGIGANLAEVRAAAAGQKTFEDVARLAQRLRIRPEAIHRAMAEYRAVQNSALAIGAAAHPSEAEVQKAARDALEKVSVKAVVLPAKPLADLQDPPTKEEIQAHFQKYRDREPGEGLNFGYYRQPTATVQYVEINRDAIMEKVGVANLEKKAKAFYEENKTTHQPFKRHAGNIPTPPTAAEGEPADAATSEYLTWEEAKPIAVAVVRKQAASKAAADLAAWIVQYAAEPWLNAERGPTRYRQAPTEAKNTDYYSDMLKRLPASLNYPEAISIKTTEAFALADAGSVPVLGAARFEPESAASMSFPRLVARSEAFIPEIPKDAGSSESDYLAMYETCPRPLRDSATGNQYVFRLIDKAPGRPAESVEEVRDEIIADLKLVRAMEAARKRLESLSACAATSSLKEAYEADSELAHYATADSSAVGGYFEPEPFSRVPQSLAAQGRPQNGIYTGAGVGRLPNEVVDQIFALAEANHGNGIFDLPDRATVVYVEVTGLTRAQEDEFNSLKKELAQQIASERWQRAVSNWLDPEQIQARSEFKVVSR
jgi:hypothetical protein